MISSDLYQSLWTGSRAQYFYDLCESGDLYTSYDGYVSNIDDAEDAINWEINALNERKNENMVSYLAWSMHGMIYVQESVISLIS